MNFNINGSIDPFQINRKDINQLEVWHWLLGKYVSVEEHFLNPWRHDTNPGCYLSEFRGMLLLKDYGKTFHNWSIYAAVCHVFITPFPTKEDIRKNFQMILVHIASRQEHFTPKTYITSKEQYTPRLMSKDRNWTKADLQDWAVYGITRKELIKDNVFPVDTYWLSSRRTGEMMPFQPKNMYDIPVGQGKKLYSMKPKRFVTNIGDTLNGTDRGHKTAYVAKFYKDYRVISNLGLSAYYTNGETTTIPQEGFVELVKNHDRIFIVRDDDPAGRNSAEMICRQGNELEEKFKPLYTQMAKDPSDVVKSFNYQTLRHELKV